MARWRPISERVANELCDRLEKVGHAEVMATHDGHAVAVRQGRIVALCFHPELTGDRRLHREFVRLAANR